jgi:type II secretory pathway pseudopilin PulG
MTPSFRIRAGLTIPELLLGMAVVGTMLAMVAPSVNGIRTSAALRGSRQQLTAAFAAARSAAVQKGQIATLTMTGSQVTVSVRNGLTGTPVRILGPLQLQESFGVALDPIGDTPTQVSFTPRGLLTPTPAGMLRYRLTINRMIDSVCLSTAGILLPRGCAL